MEEALTLPRLREDLNLFEGPRLRDGSPTWTLHDPLRNLYFRIGWVEFELLSRFRLRSGEAILKEVERVGVVEATQEKLFQLIQFLKKNELVKDIDAEEVRPSSSSNSILFFKLPLLHPDRWLTQVTPYLTLFFAPLFYGLVVLAGVASLLMLFQQWDQFWNTFIAFQNPLGVAAFAGSILFSKLIHELGHGATAKYYGLRVPTFGIAFMFLWPVFYTDTSDAWRLRSRKARMLIGSAGMIAETMLAIVASLCWLWLPEGLPKAVAFTVAVTTWSLTLLVNLNPFMRFDGYFLLSDYWDIPNLQQRAFDLGKHYIRSLLMGIEKPGPLTGESRQRNLWLITYAYTTWLYRLGLYVGLALVAYHALFKLAGLILLAVELGVLVVKPVMTELRSYWHMRSHFHWTTSNFLVLLLFVGLVGWFVTPWHSEVVAPGVWKQSMTQGVYSPGKARLDSIHVAVNDEVEADQLMFTLSMPELEYQQQMLTMQIEEQRAILQSAVMDKSGREMLHIEQQKLESLMAQKREVMHKLSRRQLYAPVSGKIAELDRTLRPGEWIEEGALLSVIADELQPSVVAYFHEKDLSRIHVGSEGRFIPEYLLPQEISIVLEDVASLNSAALEEPLLASLYQGELPVRQSQKGMLLLQDSYYRVNFNTQGSPALPVGAVRGSVVVQAEATSYFQRGWETLNGILIQESGF